MNKCSSSLVPVSDLVTFTLREARYYLAVLILKAPAVKHIDGVTVNPPEVDSFIKLNANDLVNHILGKVLCLITVDLEAVAKDSLFLAFGDESAVRIFKLFEIEILATLNRDAVFKALIQGTIMCAEIIRHQNSTKSI